MISQNLPGKSTTKHIPVSEEGYILTITIGVGI